jgi:hypothetical protein
MRDYLLRAVLRGTLAVACAMGAAGAADADVIRVGAGGNLQAALNAAQPGDTILLAAGVEFSGNFTLPVKGGADYITVRSDTPDVVLPAPGIRIKPADAPRLARIRSPNPLSAMRTAPGAHHWRLQYLEFGSNRNGYGDILAIGDGSANQDTAAEVPQHLVLQHLYVHGDPLVGQKRCISMNAAHVTLRDSHVSDCKGVGMDTQAVGAWNGPGPFLIENNYLEGAGENIMFGGADPAVPQLVATGIIFRRNHVARPMAWRDPIISTPVGLSATGTTGGSLPPGTYTYRVVARRPVGQSTIGRSTASAEVTATTTATGGVQVTWIPVPDATEYKVYGRSPGALGIVWTVASAQFVDTGAGGAAEAVPTSAGTAWLVKNLFELKNARSVVVEQNLFENHWKDGQAGYAIVFTPRNSDEACTWCVVEDVRFEFNVVRNVAAGFNVLGYDSPEVTAQTQRVFVRHNLVYDVKKSLGGNAWFMLLGDEPRHVVVDHNTVDHEGTTLIYAYGGTSANPRQMLNVAFTNNLARHQGYGIAGAHFAYGNEILNGFFPGLLFSGNYFAGAPASRYPASLLRGSEFESHFEDAGDQDYRLRTDSVLRGAASDGTDIGADVDVVMAGIAGVTSDISAPPAGIHMPSAPSGLRIIR